MGIHVPDAGRLKRALGTLCRVYNLESCQAGEEMVSREGSWEGMNVSGRQKTPGGENRAAVGNSCGPAWGSYGQKDF